MHATGSLLKRYTGYFMLLRYQVNKNKMSCGILIGEGFHGMLVQLSKLQGHLFLR
jgi:hypothetical protein